MAWGSNFVKEQTQFIAKAQSDAKIRKEQKNDQNEQDGDFNKLFI